MNAWALPINNTIITGNIDYEALKAHATGNPFYMPERYSAAAFSKIRTSINILDFIETYFGWQMKKNILNHFQMKEAVFQDPDAKISFIFPSDLSQYLAKTGCSRSILSMMGAQSVVTNKNSDLGRIIAGFRSPKQLHERVFAEVAGNFYDTNCEYKLRQSNESECLVEVWFTQEIQFLLKTKKPGNIHACAVRSGSLASLSGYLDLPFSTITEEACIHRGDECCTYRITYPHTQTHHEAKTLMEAEKILSIQSV